MHRLSSLLWVFKNLFKLGWRKYWWIKNLSELDCELGLLEVDCLLAGSLFLRLQHSVYLPND